METCRRDFLSRRGAEKWKFLGSVIIRRQLVWYEKVLQWDTYALNNEPSLTHSKAN